MKDDIRLAINSKEFKGSNLENAIKFVEIRDSLTEVIIELDKLKDKIENLEDWLYEIQDCINEKDKG